MATPKYKEFYEMMLNQNKDIFTQFQKIHNQYVLDPKKWQPKFNEIGSDILDLIRVYENRLCRQSEGAGNSKFTTSLSEKFQTEVKKHFPKINYVGMN